MTEIIKQCIRELSATQALNGVCFGNLISKILFRKSKNALVINKIEKCYYILSREDDIANERLRITSLLAELLNVIDTLLKNQLIYIVGGTYNDIIMFYEGAEGNLLTQNNEINDGANGNTLKVVDGAYQLQTKEGISLQSLDSDIGLYERLSYILTSFIYPTTLLKEYIERGFCTEEYYIAKRSLESSKKSIICAIAIAILSPIAALIIGNQWGITKIDPKQFRTLKEVSIVHDTITVIVQDTIIELLKEVNPNKR